MPTHAGLGPRTLLTVARKDPAAFTLLWRHAAREPQFAAYAAELRAVSVSVVRQLSGLDTGDELLDAWHSEALFGWLVETTLTWLERGDPSSRRHVRRTDVGRLPGAAHRTHARRRPGLTPSPPCVPDGGRIWVRSGGVIGRSRGGHIRPGARRHAWRLVLARRPPPLEPTRARRPSPDPHRTGRPPVRPHPRGRCGHACRRPRGAPVVRGPLRRPPRAAQLRRRAGRPVGRARRAATGLSRVSRGVRHGARASACSMSSRRRWPSATAVRSAEAGEGWFLPATDAFLAQWGIDGRRPAPWIGARD